MSHIEEVHEEVAKALNKLRPLFLKECQLTFIMRLPGNDEADMVISNDDLDELVKVLGRVKERASRMNKEWKNATR